MNKDINVIYFHGYGSSSATDKAVGLRTFFEEVSAPDIPLLWDEADAYLKEYVSQALRAGAGKTFVFVGTSLGGYWATRMSDLFAVPSVIINPSCRPAVTLKSYANPLLTASELSKFVALEPKSISARTVLLALDDEILDPKEAMDVFKFSDVKLFQNGGHRFSSINIIRDNIIETANFDYLSDDNI